MNDNMEKEIYEISLDDIIPNRFQPRLTFDEEAMKELTASIKEHGVIQPLVLRRLGDKYEIIAGERRYKASTLAGLEKVPAIVMNLDDDKSAEVALVENIQRKQLSAIEEAKSYQQLLDRGYSTQEELAEKLGKSQSGISNKMRLLNLSEDAQEALLANKISERHARSLLSIKNEDLQIKMLNRIINERLTVRQADQAIKELIENDPNASEEGESKMNNNSQNNNFFTEPQIEPITTINVDPVTTESTSMAMDNNNFINLNNPQANMMKPQQEELNMDVDFQDIDEPTTTKMNNIDNLLKNQSEMPEFSPIQNSPFSSDFTPTNNSINNFNEPLMPQFNPNLNQALGTQKRDIRPIISDIRQIVNNIQREGFIVDLEEFDDEHTYRVEIKIQKD